MKLNANIRKPPEPVDQPGDYIVRNVKKEDDATYPSILLEVTKIGNDGDLFRVYVPWNTKPNTNMGRLVLGYGDETDNWMGKRISIELDNQGRRHIYPK